MSNVESRVSIRRKNSHRNSLRSLNSVIEPDDFKTHPLCCEISEILTNQKFAILFDLKLNRLFWFFGFIDINNLYNKNFELNMCSEKLLIIWAHYGSEKLLISQTCTNGRHPDGITWLFQTNPIPLPAAKAPARPCLHSLRPFLACQSFHFHTDILPRSSLCYQNEQDHQYHLPTYGNKKTVKLPS